MEGIDFMLESLGDWNKQFGKTRNPRHPLSRLANFPKRIGRLAVILFWALILTPFTAQASLNLAVAVNPDPAAAGDHLNVAITVSNTSSYDRSDVVLTLPYPEHLEGLGNSLISGGASLSNSIGSYTTVEFGEFVTWNLGTIAAGSTKTVTLPPRVADATPADTVIEFAPQISDSSGNKTTASRNVIVASDRALELVLAADAEPVQPGEAFTYTLTYGHTATSAVAPDTLLELPLPDSVSFVSATAGGTLGGDTVQWNLGTLDPGQIGRVQVTVTVDASTALGSLLQTQAVLASTSQADMIARVDTVTRVKDAPPLLLAIEVLPEPAAAGESLDVRLTVSNAGTFERSDVVLWFRYPEHLNSLTNSVISGGASISNAIGSYT
ncbi:MAG: DUF11 domain-containing protein, partial [Desulfobacteraceae bacterium]|nr:DUF11 domain-containing protein [Desulfobacteraceae bacterium]